MLIVDALDHYDTSFITLFNVLSQETVDPQQLESCLSSLVSCEDRLASALEERKL